MDVIPIEKVTGVNIVLNFEEMVRLGAALNRLQVNSRNAAMRRGQFYSDTDYGQMSYTDTFLKDLHETLKDITGGINGNTNLSRLP